jgi:hypothetical protein
MTMMNSIVPILLTITAAITVGLGLAEDADAKKRNREISWGAWEHQENNTRRMQSREW